MLMVFVALPILISQKGSDQGKNLDGEPVPEVVLEAGDEAGFCQELETPNLH